MAASAPPAPADAGAHPPSPPPSPPPPAVQSNGYASSTDDDHFSDAVEGSHEDEAEVKEPTVAAVHPGQEDAPAHTTPAQVDRVDGDSDALGQPVADSRLTLPGAFEDAEETPAPSVEVPSEVAGAPAAGPATLPEPGDTYPAEASADAVESAESAPEEDTVGASVAPAETLPLRPAGGEPEVAIRWNEEEDKIARRVTIEKERIERRVEEERSRSLSPSSAQVRPASAGRASIASIVSDTVEPEPPATEAQVPPNAPSEPEPIDESGTEPAQAIPQSPALSAAPADGDDFDDFGEEVHADEFDDFDGFEEAEVGFNDEEADPPAPPVLAMPLLDMGRPDAVESSLSSAMDKMFPSSKGGPEPMEDIESGCFLTERSLSLWSQLVAPPPLQPPNWKISRIRRLFLVSLGVPVDLDEILPAETKQKKLVLPSMTSARRSTEIRPPNAQPEDESKRTNGKEDVSMDIPSARILCSTSDVALQNLSLDELKGHVERLEQVTRTASEMLTYWLKKRDGAVGDKETFETVIESLVGYARKTRQNG